MKLNKHLLAIFFQLLFILIISSCSKDDTTAPVIKLIGSSVDVVPYKSVSAYVDPGVTATDETDGDITTNVVDSGSVDVNTIGTYYLKYSITDKAGNTSSIKRVVIVDATSLFVGTFNHIDVINGITSPTLIDTLSASSTTRNKIIFKRFSGFSNAAIFATLQGTNVTIPSQTYYCGDFPTDTVRTFASNSIASTFTVNGSSSSMIINYNIIQGLDTIICSSIYTKQ